MALAPQTWINEWFQDDSWVYKGFAYWFQNPFWHKRVPSGFSLCPYFWMAIFSWMIFKPMTPVFMVAGFIFKLIGKFTMMLLERTIVPLIAGTGDYLGSHENLRIVASAFGNFIKGCFMLLLACIALLLLAVLGYNLINFYITNIYSNSALRLASYLLFSGLVVCIPCLIYMAKNRYKSDKCKVEVYMMLWLASAIACGFIFETELCTSIVVGTASVIYSIVAFIVTWICKAVVWVALLIWEVLSWGGKLIALLAIALVSSVVIGIPLLVWFCFIIFACNMVWKLLDTMEKKAAILAVNTKVDAFDWRNFLYSVLMKNERALSTIRESIRQYHKDNGLAIPHSGNMIMIEDNICRGIISDVIYGNKVKIPKFMLKYTKAQFKEIRELYTKHAKREGVDSLGNIRHVLKWYQIYDEDQSSKLEQDFEKFIAHLYEHLDLVDDSVDKKMKYQAFRTLYNDQYSTRFTMGVKSENEKIEKKEEKSKSMDKLFDNLNSKCKFVTGLFMPIINATKIVLIGIFWRWSIRAFGLGIWWVFKNIGILCAYMWKVGKGRKQGVCPYMMFTSAEKSKEV